MNLFVDCVLEWFICICICIYIYIYIVDIYLHHHHLKGKMFGVEFFVQLSSVNSSQSFRLCKQTPKPPENSCWEFMLPGKVASSRLRQVSCD